MSKKIRSLNEAQKAAVLEASGPVLIIAGAGSGKTKTLTHRLAYLVEKGTKPENILAVTFTNKAAEEMIERVKELLGRKRFALPMMGTFHSVCVRILRREIDVLGFNNNFSIYDTQDQLETIKQVMRDLDISRNDYNPKLMLKIISSAKNELITPKEFQKTVKSPAQRVAAEIFPKYQNSLKSSQALDFDDLLMMTVKIFQGQKKILKKYQNLFRHVLVDEYQDTNQAQYMLIKLLAAKHQNLYVVGDDWQSIYMFRNADIRNILNFEQDYPAARVFRLEQNYRSTQNILDVAHRVISENENQKEKKLWTKNNAGEKVIVYEAQDEKDEGRYIIEEIKRQTKDQARKRYAEHVILYRTHAQSRAIEEAFLREKIPYQIIGGLKFYDRKEIKDVLSYLRLMINPGDLASFQRVINVPSRKVGKRSLEQILLFARQNNIDLIAAVKAAPEIQGLHAFARDSLVKFGKIISAFRRRVKKENLDQLIDDIVKKSGYDKWIDDGTESGKMRLENIKELKTVAKKYNKIDAAERMETFLADVALLSDVDNYKDKSNVVTMMTIHQAKGLEFPNVFIAGFEENLFPHARSLMNQAEIEEERRLCYVAMTRAKNRLYLIYARMREYFGTLQTNPPSRFMTNLPEDLLEHLDAGTIADGDDNPFFDGDRAGNTLKEGDLIRHTQFGQGVVVEVDDDIVAVRFNGMGVKKLAKEYAPIEKVS